MCLSDSSDYSTDNDTNDYSTENDTNDYSESDNNSDYDTESDLSAESDSDDDAAGSDVSDFSAISDSDNEAADSDVSDFSAISDFDDDATGSDVSDFSAISDSDNNAADSDANNDITAVDVSNDVIIDNDITDNNANGNNSSSFDDTNLETDEYGYTIHDTILENNYIDENLKDVENDTNSSEAQSFDRLSDNPPVVEDAIPANNIDVDISSDYNHSHLNASEVAFDTLVIGQALISALNGTPEFELNNDYYEISDINKQSVSASAQVTSINDILNDYGYETKDTDEKVLINIGKAISAIGSGDENALSDPLSQRDDLREELEVETLRNNTPIAEN